MTDRPFIVLGGGGHARVVVDTLRKADKEILGYTDPLPEVSLAGVEHLGGDDILSEYGPADVFLTVGIGSTKSVAQRASLFDSQRNEGFAFPAVIHSDAIFSPETTVGAGTQVMAGAVIQPHTTLAENVIVNTNASIDHDCEIHAHAHIAPGVTISGGVSIGRNAHIGTGASIVQNVDVGARSVVGAGAAVIDDVPPDTTVVGIPAQKVEST
jgi:UDP-perosamine 4-acetyltransferase